MNRAEMGFHLRSFYFIMRLLYMDKVDVDKINIPEEILEVEDYIDYEKLMAFIESIKLVEHIAKVRFEELQIINIKTYDQIIEKLHNKAFSVLLPFIDNFKLED